MTYRQAKDLKMLPINSMNPTNTPPQLVDFITLSEVSSICEIDESELMDLVDYGAIHYHHFLNGDGLVSTQNIDSLQKACAIRRRYDMDLFMVVISFNHLEIIAELEKKLKVYMDQNL
jgi:hypothetical protein